MTTYRKGDRIQVRDINDKLWPAVYRGEVGGSDRTGVLFEINKQVSRTERHRIKKA